MAKILLAKYIDSEGETQQVSIDDYLEFVNNKDKTAIANFIYHRLYSRYLKPFQFPNSNYQQQYKNSFAIMANCCLLIETLQSFKSGWKTTNRKSEQAFKDFFLSEPNFSIFRTRETAFYKNIRCGILHQGETTGGWVLNRSEKNLFNSTTLSVDSITFAREVEKSLSRYIGILKTEDWNSDTWKLCRIKINAIISNCAIT